MKMYSIQGEVQIQLAKKFSKVWQIQHFRPFSTLKITYV